jgi:hypothetical protein
MTGTRSENDEMLTTHTRTCLTVHAEGDGSVVRGVYRWLRRRWKGHQHRKAHGSRGNHRASAGGGCHFSGANGGQRQAQHSTKAARTTIGLTKGGRSCMTHPIFETDEANLTFGEHHTTQQPQTGDRPQEVVLTRLKRALDTFVLCSLLNDA